MKIVLVYLFFSIVIFGADFNTQIKSLRFQTSTLDGKANEIVYRESDIKLSELIWKIEKVNLIGVGTTLGIKNPNLRFNADLYVNYQDGNSTMEDYDWLDYSINDWTDYSKSTTDITEVLKCDLNLEIGNFKTILGNVFFVIGYKYNSYKWKAHGGNYIYSSNTGFRDQIGEFNDVTLVSYNQFFKTPYIGIGTNFEKNKFALQGKILYSSLVKSNDEDMHHARNLYFEGTLYN